MEATTSARIVSASERVIEIVRCDESFLLAGTEAWAAPGDAGLVLHDVFHHAADDDGSMVGELMGFGVQLWIDHRCDPISLGISSDQLGAVLEGMGSQKAPGDAVQALLVASPPPHAPVNPAFQDRFIEVVSEALEHAGISRELAAIPDQLMGEICDTANRQRYVGWMAHGLIAAQIRYPDPEATFKLFALLTRALQCWARLERDSVQLTLNEAEGTVTTSDEEFQDILEALASPTRRASQRP